MNGQGGGGAHKYRGTRCWQVGMADRSPCYSEGASWPCGLGGSLARFSQDSAGISTSQEFLVCLGAYPCQLSTQKAERLWYD